LPAQRFIKNMNGQAPRSRLFLGVDIGGSKSQALIADEEGQILGLGEGGPGNYEVVGWDGLRRTLHAVVGQALASAHVDRAQIAGAGFGVAGYDWPGERAPTLEAIDSLGLQARYELVNDATIGLLAGASNGWGVVLVAGTSNNCRGRDQEGREGRVTGCGPSFGEYGGASEVVARAVQAIARTWTLRGPETHLTGAFCELVGAASAVDLLEGLALGHYHLSAAEAPLVFQVADGDDAVAQEIIRWAGRELGSLATGVIRQLRFEDLDFEVILAGSMFEGGPMLLESMRAEIHAVAPRARPVRLNAPPAVGGVLLGMEQVGLPPALLRPTLFASAQRLLAEACRPGR
jgi:N-acetylglucosamine kinase-like BadF-type ATPase